MKASEVQSRVTPLTFQHPQHHVPVLHPGPVQGHGGVGAEGEGGRQRSHQVEGLGEPLARQLSGLDDGCESGCDGREGGRALGAGEFFGGVGVGGVEGGVGRGNVQSDALMFQDIDTWRGCREREYLSFTQVHHQIFVT